MPKKEVTFYDTLEPVQKGLWNTGAFLVQFALPVFTLDVATNPTGMYDLAEEIGLENLGFAFLTLHMIANKIEFTEEARKKHKNGFVRAAANINNVAKKTGLRTLSAANVFMAPETTPQIFTASMDLLSSSPEHPVVSGMVLASGVLGALNIFVDSVTVAGKLVEKWEGRYDHHKENIKKITQRPKSEEILDPEIKQLGDKHSKLLADFTEKTQDSLIIYAEGQGNDRENETAAADPNRLQMEARLKAHKELLEKSSRKVTLPDPKEIGTGYVPPLPESALQAIRRVTAKKISQLLRIGNFYRVNSAKNPQEGKPIELRRVDRRLPKNKQD